MGSIIIIADPSTILSITVELCKIGYKFNGVSGKHVADGQMVWKAEFRRYNV